MRKNKLPYLIIGIVIAVILVFVILRTSGTKSRRQADTTIIPVSKRDISSTILATGSIKPMVGAEVKVGCRISGKVERLYANIGDWVEKDKIIAEIEKQDLEAQVAQKTAALIAAGAKLLTLEHQQPKEIELTKTDLKVAESNLQALEHQRPTELEIAKANVSGAGSSLWPGLYGEVGSGYSGTIQNMQENVSAGVKLSLPLFSRSNYSNIKKAKKELELTETKYDDKSKIAATEIEQAKLRLELTETKYADEIKIAQADIEQARAALNYAEIQLSYATIKAPISGVIASITTQEGENVAVGLSAPTFVTIVDLNRLQVDVFVDETDIGKVKVGQGATFTVDAYPNQEFSGKVIAIYPKAVIQQNVVYYDVVIAISNSDGLLRPDMTASVTIYAEKRESVLTVPNKAIKREDGKKYVYLVEDNKIDKREIKIGWRDSNYTEILTGLKEGERVILGEVEPGKAIKEDKLPPGIR